MPTDDEMEAIIHPKNNEKISGTPDEWETGLVWDELRHGLPYGGHIG